MCVLSKYTHDPGDDDCLLFGVCTSKVTSPRGEITVLLRKDVCFHYNMMRKKATKGEEETFSHFHVNENDAKFTELVVTFCLPRLIGRKRSVTLSESFVEPMYDALHPELRYKNDKHKTTDIAQLAYERQPGGGKSLKEIVTELSSA